MNIIFLYLVVQVCTKTLLDTGVCM